MVKDLFMETFIGFYMNNLHVLIYRLFFNPYYGPPNLRVN